MEELEKFEKDFERLREEMEKDNYEVEDEVLELEETVRERLEYTRGGEGERLSKLLKRIVKLKKEFNFYDADEELDTMFPDRGEDDFDEDSMSYDSVFGDD